jgi:hypothetical protein
MMNKLLLILVILLYGCSHVTIESISVDTDNIKGERFSTLSNQVIPELDQCIDMCGDGYCNEKRCKDCSLPKSGCPENAMTCKEDC